jgi:hypothetical protein
MEEIVDFGGTFRSRKKWPFFLKFRVPGNCRGWGLKRGLIIKIPELWQRYPLKRGLFLKKPKLWQRYTLKRGLCSRKRVRYHTSQKKKSWFLALFGRVPGNCRGWGLKRGLLHGFSSTVSHLCFWHLFWVLRKIDFWFFFAESPETVGVEGLNAGCYTVFRVRYHTSEKIFFCHFFKIPNTLRTVGVRG